MEFVKEGENLEPGSLLKIFKDQNNLEIGGELLNALDKTYLVHQSKMLARLALLYDVKEINRENFLRYAHIIPQLTSFLLKGLDCRGQQILDIVLSFCSASQGLMPSLN